MSRQRTREAPLLKVRDLRFPYMAPLRRSQPESPRKFQIGRPQESISRAFLAERHSIKKPAYELDSDALWAELRHLMDHPEMLGTTGRIDECAEEAVRRARERELSDEAAQRWFGDVLTRSPQRWLADRWGSPMPWLLRSLAESYARSVKICIPKALQRWDQYLATGRLQDALLIAGIASHLIRAASSRDMIAQVAGRLDTTLSLAEEGGSPAETDQAKRAIAGVLMATQYDDNGALRALARRHRMRF